MSHSMCLRTGKYKVNDVVWEPRKATRRSARHVAATLEQDEPEETQPFEERATLTDLPVELLIKSFMGLEPADLIAISKVNKHLNVVVSSARTASKLWEQSLGQVFGMIATPENMTHMQFAKLLFEDECNFCRRKAPSKIFWKWRIKSCLSCVRRCTFTSTDFTLRSPKWAFGENMFFNMLLQEKDSNGNKRVLAAEAQPVLDWLAAQGATGSVSAPEVVNFVNEHKRTTRKAIKASAILESWWADRHFHGLRTIQELSARPMLAPQAEMRLALQAVCREAEARVAYLTPRTYGALVPFVENVWSRLLLGEFHERYWDTLHSRRSDLAWFMEHHGINYAGTDERGWPRTADFCFNIPEAQAMIKSHPTRTIMRWDYSVLFNLPAAGSIDLPSSSENIEYETIMLDTPLCIRNWQISIGQRCLSVSDQALLPPPENHDLEFLCAPTTWFRCQLPKCTKPLLRIRDVCTHECMYKDFLYPPKRDGKAIYPEDWPKGRDRQSYINIALLYGCAWGDYVRKLPALDEFAGKVALFLLEMYRAMEAELPEYGHSAALQWARFAIDGQGSYSFEDTVLHVYELLMGGREVIVKLVSYTLAALAEKIWPAWPRYRYGPTDELGNTAKLTTEVVRGGYARYKSPPTYSPTVSAFTGWDTPDDQ